VQRGETRREQHEGHQAHLVRLHFFCLLGLNP
jgi:hypothetical protein